MKWEDNITMDLREVCCEDRTGSESCFMVEFSSSGVDPSGSMNISQGLV
jgi:hypothetical protein